MKDFFLKLYVTANSVLTSDLGQSMTEYAMAVGLIAFGCVAGEAAIARSVNQTFMTLASSITTGLGLPQ
jgi:Flp pilus assembly pilin Flp